MRTYSEKFNEHIDLISKEFSDKSNNQRIDVIPANFFMLNNFEIFRKHILSVYESMYDCLAYTPKASYVVQKCLDYIDDNYSSPLSLSEISEEFDISYSYLSYLFVKETKQKLHPYINKIRIAHAKELLAATSSKIYEIAHAVGFENPYYFSKVFKEVTGLTCSEYRKQKLRQT